ncbi:MAG: hypothetical protein QOI92_1241 [Chloroflexota bacterium]|jgi:hypothetical protein|nr:hypothetical protein [Chloroflexota bacterium]
MHAFAVNTTGLEPSRRRSLFLAALVSLAVAACGGVGATKTPGAAAATVPSANESTGAGIPAGSSTDACALLTAQEIKDVTGFDVLSATAGAQMGIFATGCDWELDSKQGVSWTITIGVLSPGGRAYYDKYFAPEATDSVPGIGDVAIRRFSDNYMAVKGDTLLALDYSQFTPHAGVAEELFKRAVNRL